jgi:hypothetical protein
LMTITQHVTDLCLNEIERRGQLRFLDGSPVVPYCSGNSPYPKSNLNLLKYRAKLPMPAGRGRSRAIYFPDHDGRSPGFLIDVRGFAE